MSLPAGDKLVVNIEKNMDQESLGMSTVKITFPTKTESRIIEEVNHS